MAKVITPGNGRVIIECTLEEAMAVEMALAFFSGTPRVEGALESRIFGVWDKLDDLRRSVEMQHPTDIPLDLRQARRGE